jgi:hypothetical protein
MGVQPDRLDIVILSRASGILIMWSSVGLSPTPPLRRGLEMAAHVTNGV